MSAEDKTAADLQTIIKHTVELTDPLASIHQGMKIMRDILGEVSQLDREGDLTDRLEFTIDAIDMRLDQIETLYGDMHAIGERREKDAKKGDAR